MSIWNKSVTLEPGISGQVQFYHVDGELGLLIAAAYDWGASVVERSEVVANKHLTYQTVSSVRVYAAVRILGKDIRVREDQMLVEARGVALEPLLAAMRTTLEERGYQLSIA